MSLSILTASPSPVWRQGLYGGILLHDPVILKIAKAYGKSSAQVIFCWNQQKGVVVIPGSSNPGHIQDNTELFDFALTDQEMKQINALDRNENTSIRQMPCAIIRNFSARGSPGIFRKDKFYILFNRVAYFYSHGKLKSRAQTSSL